MADEIEFKIGKTRYITANWSIDQDDLLEDLESNIEDLDPEYIKLIDEKFWDII